MVPPSSKRGEVFILKALQYKTYKLNVWRYDVRYLKAWKQNEIEGIRILCTEIKDTKIEHT